MMARLITFHHQLLVLLSIVSSSGSFLTGSAHAQSRQNSIRSRHHAKLRDSGGELFDLLKQPRGAGSESGEAEVGDAGCQTASSGRTGTFRIPPGKPTRAPCTRVRPAGLSRVRPDYRSRYSGGVSATRDGINNADNIIDAFASELRRSHRQKKQIRGVSWRSPRQVERSRLRLTRSGSRRESGSYDSTDFSSNPRPGVVLPFLSQRMLAGLDARLLSEGGTLPRVNNYGGFVSTKNRRGEEKAYVKVSRGGRLTEEMLSNNIDAPLVAEAGRADNEGSMLTDTRPYLGDTWELASERPGEDEDEDDSDPEVWPSTISDPARTQAGSLELDVETPFDDAEDYDYGELSRAESREGDDDLGVVDRLLKLEHQWSVAAGPRRVKTGSQQETPVARASEADLVFDGFARVREPARHTETSADSFLELDRQWSLSGGPRRARVGGSERRNGGEPTAADPPVRDFAQVRERPSRPGETSVFEAVNKKDFRPPEPRTPQSRQKKPFIYGSDDRLRVSLPQMRKFPFSNIARLSTGCTGTLVTPRHVLTAAHCVHNGKGFRNNLEKLKIEIPDTMGFKDYYAEKIAIPTGWLATNNGSLQGIAQSRQRAIYDYAVVRLKLAVAGHTHFLPLAVPRPEVLKMEIHFLAFPENDQQLWRSVCQAPKHMALGDGNLIMTRCDAAVGNSGAAVFTQDPHDGMRVVGILSNTVQVTHHRSLYRYSIITALTWPKLNVICSDLGMLGQRYKVCPRARNMRRSHSPPKVKAIPFFG